MKAIKFGKTREKLHFRRQSFSFMGKIWRRSGIFNAPVGRLSFSEVHVFIIVLPSPCLKREYGELLESQMPKIEGDRSWKQTYVPMYRLFVSEVKRRIESVVLLCAIKQESFSTRILVTFLILCTFLKILTVGVIYHK